MSAPGSPTSARRSPQPQQFRNEYTSSYSDHFSNTLVRPSSAPPSTTPRRHYEPQSSPLTPSILAPTPLSPSLSPSTPRRYSPSSPITPRHEPTTMEVANSPTNRFARYSWNNKVRNPLTEGDDVKTPSGRKSVPSYFDNLEKFDEDTKRLSRKSRPEPTNFFVDPSRAGIPTLIQRIRTHEEDIYIQKRPSTAPSSPMARDDDIPAAGYSQKIQPSRRPCQIEKFNVRRNPLIESGEMPPSRRTVIGFNKESDSEVQMGRKTIVVPPSLQKVTRTTEYFIPGEMPASEPVRLRVNQPVDSDIFNHSHPLVSDHAPHLMGAIEKEQAQKSQERELEKAHQERVSFYNDEIKKFKAKAKLKKGGL